MKSTFHKCTLAFVLLALHTAAVAGIWMLSESEKSSEFSAMYWLPLVIVDLPALFAAHFLGFVGQVGQVHPWVSLIVGGIQWFLEGFGIQAVFTRLVVRHRNRTGT